MLLMCFSSWKPLLWLVSHTLIFLEIENRFGLCLGYAIFWKENFLSFFFLRATPTPHGSSQARGQIGAVAANLHHSNGNARPEPHLQPTPQPMAMLDP